MKTIRPYILLLLALIVVSCAGSNDHYTHLTHPKNKTCEVHHEKMNRERVPISYGLIARNSKQKELWEARKILFPNAHRRAYGGCEVGWLAPKKAKVYYCHRCREAEEIWKKEHGFN